MIPKVFLYNSVMPVIRFVRFSAFETYHRTHRLPASGIGDIDTFIENHKVVYPKILENHSNLRQDQFYTERCRCDSCDLISLDLEGFEPFAITGAIETINKFKPVVIVERNSGSKDLEKLGYKEANERLIDDNLWIHESQLPKEKEYK